jgi:hypothetical protein
MMVTVHLTVQQSRPSLCLSIHWVLTLSTDVRQRWGRGSMTRYGQCIAHSVHRDSIGRRYMLHDKYGKTSC